MAEALKQNITLQSFRMDCGHTSIGDVTGVAMAEALKQNIMLQSFTMRCGFTSIGDVTGVAMAEALKQNITLQSFTMRCGFTSIGDETGVAMAEALKQNITLQSFTMGCIHTSIRDVTGVAMAEALKQNITLQSFTMHCRKTPIGDETKAALEEAITQATQRNQALRAQRHSLARLARWSGDTGFQSLSEGEFRKRVFQFFLPPGCKLMPVDFLNPQRVTQTRGEVAGAACAEMRAHHEVAAVASAGAGSAQSEGTVLDPAKEEQLGLALEQSMADATDRENSDLADAIMRSKSDTPLRLHENSVVVLRLTRHAQAAEVVHEILQSPDLEKCRAMVLEAGCELRPKWAGGAWLLLPLTREQFEEAGLEPTPVHIIALSRDEDALRRALKAVPKEKRPKLRTENHDADGPCGASQRADAGSDDEESMARQVGSGMGQEHREEEEWFAGAASRAGSSGDRIEIAVERTFVHFPMPREDHAASVCKSAP
ncbi:unnamed protein product [Polarella glacialis]|uniref:Uncharacterized protein n=2 Tax=Polarella glacialis TaxID=89957 RepID=A0A813E7D9_POLGL|nr:unnamed protein product [Polarella glacialis]